MFKPMKTSDVDRVFHKVLVVAPHGYGKTTQAKHFAKRFGKGFIISGESGLSSISDIGIDYLPFSSWDGEVDESKGIYSFKSIVKLMGTPEFKAQGYNWVMIDSITELSERCFDHVEEKHKGSKDGFAVWGDYERAIVGALKYIRDMQYHVCATCLVLESEDDNGQTVYAPLVKQKKVGALLPALFDHVFCGVRATIPGPTGTMPKVERFLVTDQVKGYSGKARDPKQRLAPIERTSNVVELLDKISMSDDAYESYRAAQAAAHTTKE